MNRFGLALYRENNLNEYATRRAYGQMNGQTGETRPPEVFFCHDAGQQMVLAVELAERNPGVLVIPFEVTTGYKTQPGPAAQFSISTKGILPV